MRALGAYVCDYSPSAWAKSSCSLGLIGCMATSALAAIPGHFYLFLICLFISLSLDSSARYAMNFRYWKRPVTGALRLLVVTYLALDFQTQYGWLMIASDPPQQERFFLVVLSMFFLLIELWCDVLWFINTRGEGSFEILERFPGNVWVCRRKLRSPGGYQRNTHRVEAQLTGQVNDARNREMVDQVFLIAYVEGLVVELIHTNPKDFEHVQRRMQKTGRRPRVVQTKTFNQQNPNAAALMEWLDAARRAGFAVFEDEHDVKATSMITR